MSIWDTKIWLRIIQEATFNSDAARAREAQEAAARAAAEEKAHLKGLVQEQEARAERLLLDGHKALAIAQAGAAVVASAFVGGVAGASQALRLRSVGFSLWDRTMRRFLVQKAGRRRFRAWQAACDRLSMLSESEDDGYGVARGRGESMDMFPEEMLAGVANRAVNTESGGSNPLLSGTATTTATTTSSLGNPTKIDDEDHDHVVHGNSINDDHEGGGGGGGGGDDDGDDDLPPGWDEMVDTDTGKIYFLHHDSEEISWAKPEKHPKVEDMAEAADAVADIFGTGNAADGDHGSWGEVFDQASGQSYYFNKVTNETSWDPPTGVKGGDATVEAEAADGGSGGSNDNDDEEYA